MTNSLRNKILTASLGSFIAVSPAEDGGKGSTFALVYVHTRGKQADI
jgi:hypothetical protein